MINLKQAFRGSFTKIGVSFKNNLSHPFMLTQNTRKV